MKALRIAVGIAMIVASACRRLRPPRPARRGLLLRLSCRRGNAASTVPRLYGRDAAEITTAMTGFRDGSLPSTVMDRIAKGFSDDEMRAIAAWLAAQK